MTCKSGSNRSPETSGRRDGPSRISPILPRERNRARDAWCPSICTRRHHASQTPHAARR
jgi:hypothetical protein